MAVRAGTAAGAILASPMPGVVLEVLVGAGATVARGDPLLVLEAMKMRNTIRAPRDALVVEVPVEPGQPVGPGQPLVRFGGEPG
jgi:biotin carboxyl carrier protein